MATNILRRQFATSAQSTLRIGLIPADGIGREGKESNRYKEKENLSPYFSSIV
jgi:homoisocitrate dehydrogenase